MTSCAWSKVDKLEHTKKYYNYYILCWFRNNLFVLRAHKTKLRRYNIHVMLKSALFSKLAKANVFTLDSYLVFLRIIIFLAFCAACSRSGVRLI